MGVDTDESTKIHSDVIVVGGGPAGASAAYHLSLRGLDVALFDRATFPRDKICGDGLTPSAVHELHMMGVNTKNWAHNKGLRVLGGGHQIYVRWPEQSSLPLYGVACPRKQLDEQLLQRARSAGARIFEDVRISEAIRSSSGRVVGVLGHRGKGVDAEEVVAKAKLVVDAGGVSARLATSLGITKIRNRPMGVAARTYFHSPLGDDDWMESHLELWDGKPGESELLPGYGWIFPLGNGLVNVGLGSVSSNATSAKLPLRKVFSKWTENLPKEWGITSENQVGVLQSAALPMSFNRKPHYANGLALVGDAGGMVSPFNGEGIAAAMKSGRFLAGAAERAFEKYSEYEFDLAMGVYPIQMGQVYGGYYSLGRIFVKLIENPKVMSACTRYGLPRKRLMKFVNKLLSDGYERSGGDIDDRIIVALTKVVPKV